MNISLPQRFDEMLRRQVESGAYTSYSEVVIEALLLFEEREEIRRLRRERLLAEVAKGIYQADTRQFVDQDDVFKSLRKKPASSNA